MIVITTKREVKCNHLYYVLKEENVDSRNMVVSSKTNKKSKKKNKEAWKGEVWQNISATQPYLSDTRHILWMPFNFQQDPRRTVVTPSEVGSPENKK